MELGRKSFGSTLILPLLLIACGGPAEKAPQTPSSVSTTHTSAAEMSADVADAPHASAPQAHGESAADISKDEPRRHSERRPGGGFSGYK